MHTATAAYTSMFTCWYTRPMATMLRVSEETRDRVLQVATEDFGGISADEAVQRLLDEHWRAKVLAAVRAIQANDPEQWTEYLAEASEWEAAQAPVMEPWDEAKAA